MKSKILTIIIPLLFIGCTNVKHRDDLGLIGHENFNDYDSIKTDKFIRGLLAGEEKYIERKWIIQYKNGINNSESGQWYIYGTIWWARIINIDSMDVLNKDKIYQLQGLALEQNYGVISIFEIKPSLHEIKWLIKKFYNYIVVYL